VTWGGRHFVVTWSDNRSGRWEVYAARLSAVGVLAGPEVSLTGEDGFDSAQTAVSGADPVFGVVWTDSRHGPSEVYFTRVGCM
jgi:hypothetical protein